MNFKDNRSNRAQINGYSVVQGKVETMEQETMEQAV
jgi:hypothetical protein